MNPFQRFFRAANFLVLLITLSGSALQAQEFRVETEIFLERRKEPISENLTLFSNNIAYDFMLTEPMEITIFDPKRQRIILLDVKQKVKVTVNSELLAEYVAKLKTSERQKKEPFFFDPHFKVSFDKSSKWLTMSSQRMMYRVKTTQPEDDSVAAQYKQFTDWYARLNSTTPGTMPPFARLDLNRQLAQRGVIPEEVHLTVSPEKKRLGQKKLRLRSHHLIIYQLSRTDRQRIERAEQYNGAFQPIGFSDYQQQTKVARSK